MEPLAVIVSAVAQGAGASDAAHKSAYDDFKALLVRKFDAASGVGLALRNLEERPASKPRQGVLSEELAAVQADQDAEVLQAAQRLLDQLGNNGGASYQAHVEGSGAVAQGDGATAVGAGGVVIGGDVRGDIITGPQTIIHYYDDSQPEPGMTISAAVRKLNGLLDQWFNLSDLEGIAFNLGIDWDNLRGETKAARARALVLYCETHALLDGLRAEIASARPNLRGEL